MTDTGEEKTPIAPKLQRPLAAYDYATSMPVYSLSQLMFVGLLASYVLGFVTFASDTASLLTNPDIIRYLVELFQVSWEHTVLRAPYLCISLTFAFATASIYVSYHTGILTMPDRPDNQVSWDFLLALTPAIFFGISMLYPFLFPACVGLFLIAATIRQYFGYRHVTSMLAENIIPSGQTKKDKEAGLQHLRKEWTGIIKGYDSFSTWRKSSWWILFIALVLLALNVFMWYGLYLFTPRPQNIGSVNQAVVEMSQPREEPGELGQSVKELSQNVKELSQSVKKLTEDLAPAAREQNWQKNVIVFVVSLGIVLLTFFYTKGALGKTAGLMFGKMRSSDPQKNLDKRFDNLLMDVKKEIDEDQRRRDSK